MAHKLRQNRSKISTADSTGNFSLGCRPVNYHGFHRNESPILSQHNPRDCIEQSWQNKKYIQKRPKEIELCNNGIGPGPQRFEKRNQSNNLQAEFGKSGNNKRDLKRNKLCKTAYEQRRESDQENDKLHYKPLHSFNNKSGERNDCIKGLPVHKNYIDQESVKSNNSDIKVNTEVTVVNDYCHPQNIVYAIEKRPDSRPNEDCLNAREYFMASGDAKQNNSTYEGRDGIIQSDEVVPENYATCKYANEFSVKTSNLDFRQSDEQGETSFNNELDKFYEDQGLISNDIGNQYDQLSAIESLPQTATIFQQLNFSRNRVTQRRDHSQYDDYNTLNMHQNINCSSSYERYEGINILKSTRVAPCSFDTMQNAREVAKQIGLLFNEDTDTINHKESANKLQKRRNRKCWSKFCWSSERHSHALWENIQQRNDKRNHFDRGYLDYNTMKRKIDHQHQELKEHTVDIWNKIKRPFTFWKEDLKRIEGRYGTGVLSYFLFLQWLVYLNLLMTIIVISFIVIPENIFHFKEQSISNTSVTNTTYFHSQIHVSNLECGHKFCNVEYATNTNYTQKNPVDLAYFCSGNYSKNIEKKNYVIEKLQEFLQGTGWMELTPMFIGWYTPTEMRNIDVKPSYDIPITYMLVTFSYFLLCLILMVFYTRRSIRENVMKAESQLQRFCNMVFTGWDFSIEDKKLAEIKHGNIHQNLRSHLAAARRYAEISQWSTRKKFRVTFLRIMVNIFVVIILALSGYCIYEAVHLAEQVQGDTGLIAFLTEYLSSIIITALNLFLPKLFDCLAKLEQYSLSFTIKITLLRCVFSQLASVCVLIATLHNLVMCDDKTECGNGIGDCKAPVCWETYVGQQIYKLAILDFAIVIIVTFLVGYPKKIIAERCQCKLISYIKREEFNIPDNVLSLVSSQTLCWLGAFYSPFLPLLSLIKYIAIFYVKKYSLFVICVPAKEPYKTSKSNTFFMIVLMLSYLIGLFSFVYSVSTIMPSRGCGPFRIYDTAWDTMTVFISRFPPQVITVLYFIGSAGFGIPAFIILSLLLYYYLTISATYGQMADILKDHLLVEGRDKHFLLKKLMIILRQPEL